MDEYKVGIIGLNGSGKTIYMSSLYYLLASYQHPAITLRAENDPALLYFTKLAQQLDELDWNDALNATPVTLEPTQQLSLTVDIGKQSMGVHLIDYRGEDIDLERRLSAGANAYAQEFLTQCDAFLVFVPATSFNEHGVLRFQAQQSIGHYLQNLPNVANKPFGFVVSQADVITTNLANYSFGNQPLNLWKKLLFDGFENTLRAKELTWTTTDQSFVYVVSAKLCVELLKSVPFTFKERVTQQPELDLARPIIDLLTYCNRFISTSQLQARLARERKSLWLADHDQLSTQLNRAGERTEREVAQAWEAQLTRAIARKHSQLDVLMDWLPPVFNGHRREVFTQRVRELRYSLVPEQMLNDLKTEYGIQTVELS